ncbi:Uma2 family endonuclease [Nostoc sp. CHAB 5834]|nr:Uma2 family endonuclease [Nostoc sp. CHAB 5834]
MPRLQTHEQKRKLRISEAGCGESRTPRFNREVRGIISPIDSTKGRVVIEWAIKLKRNQQDWVPVADLTYVSYNRLSADWLQDEACPVAPELVIEIISPSQTFGEMTEKATDYLKAKVQRVWIIDSRAKTITIFYPDILPQTKGGTESLEDSLFEGLQITPQEIFQQARISY